MNAELNLIVRDLRASRRAFPASARRVQRGIARRLAALKRSALTRIPPKAGDDALAAGDALTEDDLYRYLTEMADFDPLRVVREFAKREGVRFEVADFGDGDIAYKNQYVLTLTGKAAEAFDLAHERAKQRVTGKQALKVRGRAGARRGLRRKKVRGHGAPA